MNVKVGQKQAIQIMLTIAPRLLQLFPSPDYG